MRHTVSSNHAIDRIFRAFSDPTRLRILCVLQAGECCVGDIVEILGIEQPHVSRHLGYLRQTGLVIVRKEKTWSYYSLAPARGTFHEKLLECLACCFQEVPQIQADLIRVQELKKVSGCCPETTVTQPSPSNGAGKCCS